MGRGWRGQSDMLEPLPGGGSGEWNVLPKARGPG
jgi:hypothetical protein